ncbi:hypothetical protein [Allorhizocola rhizosphaerae]|uniref:hypothetical protein n=1 Tax=Allorhizocola rhizosphaerae TaxID=1872709 RepID=UPI000E3D7579|nr:hypothetical protein [Allorhizocola rhizosphaerae]
MTWRWRYEAENGKPVDGPREDFTSQADAESWLGQTWRDLLGSGIATAVLVEDDRVEYKMSLKP